MTDTRIIKSPLGNIRISADGEGLTEVQFCNQSAKKSGDNKIVAAAVRQLNEYFDGKRRQFDLPLNPPGTEFQHRVWEELLTVKCGDTASYGAIANAIGKPTASRAVGAANGRNPIAIIVPCHRIIGTSGSLTGYAGGLQRKQWLLAHEQEMVGGVQTLL